MAKSERGSLLLGALILFVLACGGGGGETAISPPPAPPPIPGDDGNQAQQIEGIIQTGNPLAFPYMDFDTDGDGYVDYRIVGDYNGNGLLEWDDIQLALDDLCDPNRDGIQDARDGRMIDRDGDGIAVSPFCGTIHIMPGTWKSRIDLDPDRANRKDDQIHLGSYQGLTFKGSGVDVTVLKTVYSRQDFCRYHHETGCGGVCSRESRGWLTLSDFTFEGLEPRAWGKMDCDGDGFDAGEPGETDYTVRTLQSGVVVFNSAELIGSNVTVRNIKVSKVDYNGFALGNLENLTARNLSVHSAGAAGILFAGIAASYASTLHVENASGPIAAGGVSVFSNQAEAGQPENQMTRDFVLDGIVSRNNHMGIHIAAFGAGGIRGVTVRNFNILESRDRTGTASAYTNLGIYLQDNDCVYDADGDGLSTDYCYVRDIVMDTGTIQGCPGYGFSANPRLGGPDRNYTIRNVTFLGNGSGLGGSDSRDVNLPFVHGTIFEDNLVFGVDYNLDGTADLTHLVRVEANNVIIRRNSMMGSVAGGISSLLHISGGDTIQVRDNLFQCAASQNCQPINIGPAAVNVIVEGNEYR